MSGILENYGIDCETDVSLIDRDDFFKLVSNGLNPMEGKKLELWCDVVVTVCKMYGSMNQHGVSSEWCL